MMCAGTSPHVLHFVTASFTSMSYHTFLSYSHIYIRSKCSCSFFFQITQARQ